MSYTQLKRVLAMLAIASGVALVLDGAVLDAFAAGSYPAKLAGLTSLILGVFGLTGIYLVERDRQPCFHLDVGYFLNVAGLVALVGVGFARNFVLDELDDSVVDALIDSGPTLPGILIAAVVAVIGTVTFSTALIRHGFDTLGSWAYMILLTVGGFAAQLPEVLAAVSQGLGGLAIIRLGWVALSRVVVVAGNDYSVSKQRI